MNIKEIFPIYEGNDVELVSYMSIFIGVLLETLNRLQGEIDELVDRIETLEKEL